MIRKKKSRRNNRKKKYCLYKKKEKKRKNESVKKIKIPIFSFLKIGTNFFRSGNLSLVLLHFFNSLSKVGLMSSVKNKAKLVNDLFAVVLFPANSAARMR